MFIEPMNTDGDEVAKLLLISTSAADVEFAVLFKLQPCLNVN